MDINTLKANELKFLYDFTYNMGSKLGQTTEIELDNGEKIKVSSEAPEFTPFLVGPSGIGKTAILRKWAKDNGVSIFTFIPSQITANDLTFPVVKNGKVFLFINEKFQNAEILFIDEMNRISAPEQIAAILSIISNKEFAGQPLNAKMIIAAANPASDEFEGAYDIEDEAILKRLAPINVVPDWDYVKAMAPFYSESIDQARAKLGTTDASAKYVAELIERKTEKSGASPREFTEAAKIINFAMMEGYTIKSVNPNADIYQKIVDILAYGLLGIYAVKMETIPVEIFKQETIVDIIQKFGVYPTLAHLKVYVLAKMINISTAEKHFRDLGKWISTSIVEDPLIIGSLRSWINHFQIAIANEKDNEKKFFLTRLQSILISTPKFFRILKY